MAKDKTNFSERLTDLLAKRGLTVKEASEIAGTGTSQIQSWKSGSLSTDYEALQKLAKGLGVSLEYLLLGTNSKDVGIEEVFGDADQVFDGYLKVKIERMIPKKKIKGEQ